MVLGLTMPVVRLCTSGRATPKAPWREHTFDLSEDCSGMGAPHLGYAHAGSRSHRMPKPAVWGGLAHNTPQVVACDCCHFLDRTDALGWRQGWPDLTGDMVELRRFFCTLH
jgi:hypothetical protein